MLAQEDEKLILENLSILTESFRLLSERENFITSSNIEESERLYAIGKIRNAIPRWRRKKELADEDKKMIINYFGIFLEAIYLFKRNRKISRKKILKIEEVFERMIPYKVKEATMEH
ncbi:MAG: hypothetical protein ACOCVY_00840 [Patescibacteria group bacterium]